MSGELINNADEEVVTIDSKHHVSMKLVQSIYNEITGKTESLTKPLKGNHILTIEDIKQLNTKICQLYEQYNVVADNCTVTVYHVNDCKEQFSSFDRFLLYDKGNMNPCENVRLVYNFLIVLPGTKKAQPYEIIIDLHSRVGLRKKAESEYGMSRNIIRLVSSRTGSVDITFVDYTVARNFLVAVEHWYEAIEKQSSNKLVSFLQSKGLDFSSIFKTLTSVLITCIFLFSYQNFITADSTNDKLFVVSLIVFSTLFISSHAASKAGRILENRLEIDQTISGLDLNRGDESALKSFKRSTSKNHFIMVLTVTQIILINVISTFIAKSMGA